MQKEDNQQNQSYKNQEYAESNKKIGSRAKQGILWTVLFDGFQFVFRFAGSIILARILFPEDFGLMAIVSIVIQLSRRLTNFGFTMVLVQRKEIKAEHFDTVFITNFFLMLILTIGLYLSSPFVAVFFSHEKIEPIVKVIGIYFLLTALTSVPISVLKRKMKFRELAIAHTIGEMVAVIAPVGFAMVGFGVWSLVFGLLLGIFSELIALLVYSSWFPRFKFHLWALKDVFSFGLWFYIGGFVNYGINKVDFFIVGKVIDVVQLGLYERAFNLMGFPRQQLALKINSVMFSTYSRIQDDDERTIQVLQKLLLHISIIAYPLMTWMFFVAPSLILVLFGHKWVASIYPFQVMCIAGILDTLTLTLYPIVLARGLIGNRARRDFVYLLVLSVCVLIGTNWGINGVAWGTTGASVFRLALMLNLVLKALPFSIRSFIRSQKSAIIYSICLIGGLLCVKIFMVEFTTIYSVLMFVSMSVAAVLILVGSHLIIRFKDIDSVIGQLFLDLGGIKQKLAKMLRPTPT